MFLQMTYDEWVEKYKPIKNPNGGDTFETYGSDIEFVKDARRKNPYTVWTYLDGADGEIFISSGAHVVNRISYCITEIPYGEDDTVEVTVPDDNYFEPELNKN